MCIQVWDQGEARLRMYAKSSLLFSTGPIKYRAGRRYMSPTLGRSWKALYHCYNLTADIEKKTELKKNSNNKAVNNNRLLNIVLLLSHRYACRHI